MAFPGDRAISYSSLSTPAVNGDALPGDLSPSTPTSHQQLPASTVCRLLTEKSSFVMGKKWTIISKHWFYADITETQTKIFTFLSQINLFLELVN